MTRLLLVAMLLIAATDTVARTEPIRLTPGPLNVNALLSAEYLVDRDDRYSVYQLRQNGLASRFTPVHNALLRNGFFEGSVWLRIPVLNPTERSHTYFFYVDSHANHSIDVFSPSEGRDFDSWRSGASIPHSERPYALGTYVLPVKVNPGQQMLYIKLSSQDPLTTGVTLLDDRSLNLTLAWETSVHSALLALQMLFLVFTLWMYGRSRHSVFIWAGLFSLGLIGFNAGWHGLASFVLDDLAYIDIHARNVGALLTLVALVGLLANLRQEHHPGWLRETLRWTLRGLVLLCTLTLLPYSLHLSTALLILVPLVLGALIALWFYRRDRAVHEYWLLADLGGTAVLYLLIAIASIGLTGDISIHGAFVHLVSLTIMALVCMTAYRFWRHQDVHLTADGLDIPTLHWPLLRKLNHELRGPINGVLGMTELMQDTSLSAHQQEYVNTVQAAGFSLLRQADQLQNLVRIGLNRLPESEDEFDLYDLLEDTIQPYSRLAHAKQLELVMDVAPELPTRYRGNAQIISQVLSNLLDNALSYTDSGEVLIQVKPWNNQRVRFSVTDTGPGLPKESKNSLFDFPSTRSDEPLTPRDVHLGLPISRVLVNLLGGQLSYSSELRMGTTFWIDLPLQEVAETSNVDDYTSQDLDQIRLMVVDDNLTCRKVIEHLGKSWGMDVFSMSNGQSALANLHNEYHKGTPIDVLVLDQNMPGMTGTELAERIRTDDALNRDMVIIMLTGVDVGHGELDSSRLNISYLLTKPVSGRALRQTLTQAMPELLTNRKHHHVKTSLFD